VIRNNLALIRKNQKKYEEALKLFSVSRNEYHGPLKTRYDSIALAYIQIEIASCYLGLKDHLHAGLYIDSAYDLASGITETKELYYILLVKSQFAIMMRDFKTAWSCVGKEEEMRKVIVPDKKEKNDFNLVRSNLLEIAGDREKALALYREYHRVSDSLYASQKIAQILQIKSENEYFQLQEKVRFLTKQNLMLLFLFLTAGIFLSILGVQYLRIRGKNRYTWYPYR
jgi:tetratricopeptide (TPR) repeat protein